MWGLPGPAAQAHSQPRFLACHGDLAFVVPWAGHIQRRPLSLCCRVVGGFDTLTAMENVESDPKTDRPKEEIRIDSTTVFVDPYEEADAQVRRVRLPPGKGLGGVPPSSRGCGTALLCSTTDR